MARLKDYYVNEVAPALMKKFEYKSSLQIPQTDRYLHCAFSPCCNMAGLKVKHQSAVRHQEMPEIFSNRLRSWNIHIVLSAFKIYKNIFQ